jgi:hypothetical protein
MQGMLARSRPHAGPVWGVCFHPSRPSTLVSCGEDGCLIFSDVERMQTLARAAGRTGVHGGGEATSRVVYRGSGALNAVAADRASGMIFAASDTEALLYTSCGPAGPGTPHAPGRMKALGAPTPLAPRQRYY